MTQLRLQLVTALLILASPATPAMADDKPAPIVAEFPAGVETCYGRAYGKAHLARHPRQRVTALYLMRSLTDDPRSEEEPRTGDENIAANLEQERSMRAEEAGDANYRARTTLKVLVKFKDKREVFVQDVDCHKADKGEGFRCGVDCDGGSFNANVENGSLMFRLNGGLRVRSGCSNDDETGPEEHIYESEDAHLFRLESMPISSCHEVRDEARPDWAQASADTLRARFATGAGQCFVSAPGLGKKTGHKIERLALTTLDLPKADPEDTRPSLHVRFDATLAKGKSLTRELGCYGWGYGFDCDFERSGFFRLTRTTGKAITLRETYYRWSELAPLLGIEQEELFDPIALEPADAAQCAAVTH